MKKLYPLFFLSLFSLLFSQKEYNLEDIVEQGGVYKKKFSTDLINGSVYKMYKKNKVPLGNMKKGLKEGIWKDWYENGVLKSEINYNNGKVEGSHKTYNIDGLLSLYMKVINYDKNNYIKYGLDKNGNLDGREMYYLNSKGTGTTLKTIDFDRKVKSRNLKKGSQMISTFKDGGVTKVEIFNNNKELLHVFDCINTDDCLTDNQIREKRFKLSKELYKEGYFTLSYFSDEFSDEEQTEVLFFLENKGGLGYNNFLV